jgi:hypothetical protein
MSYYGEYSAEIDAEIDAADEAVFALSVAEGRWLVTENVKDFGPILSQALQAGTPLTGMLFTSSRTFPRSRQNPAPLTEALAAWLKAGPPPPPLTEDWLQGGGG